MGRLVSRKDERRFVFGSIADYVATETTATGAVVGQCPCEIRRVRSYNKHRGSPRAAARDDPFGPQIRQVRSPGLRQVDGLAFNGEFGRVSPDRFGANDLSNGKKCI